MQQKSALVSAAQSAVPATMVLGAVSKFTQVNLISTATSTETIRAKIWRLSEELIKMASIYAADAGQPIDNFIISE